MPGYTWPSELFVSQSSYSPGSSIAALGGPSQQKSLGLQAGIGVAVGVLGVLVVAAAAWLVKRRQKHRKLQQQGEGKSMSKGDACMETAGAGACGAACMNGLSDSPQGNGFRVKAGQPQHLDQLLLDGTGEEQGLDTTGVHDTIGQLPNGQGVQPAAEGTAAAADDAAAVAAGVASAAAAGTVSGKRVAEDKSASSKAAGGRSPSSRSAAAQGSRSSPRPPTGGTSAAAADPAADGQQPVAGSISSTGASSVEQTIAHGLERWNAAVSTTTLQLMQRRLQSNNALYSALTAGGSSLGATTAAAAAATPAANPSQQQQQQQQPSRGRATAVPSVTSAASSSSAGADGVDQEHGLQLHGMIGTGSFGSVYLGSWRGKRVAVKVMHLQNNALMSGDGPPAGANTPQQEQLERQKHQNSPPQMAIMEAVVSSTMSHPNVSNWGKGVCL